MRRIAFAVGVAALASSVWQVHAAPARRTGEAGVLDRSYSCSTALIGGVHQAKVHARRGSGKKAGAWHRPALAALTTTITGDAERAIYDQIAWVSAGRPARSAVVFDNYSPDFEFPMQSWGTIGVNAAQCRPSSASVSFDRRGLAARDVGPLDYPYDCASARVMVRIRAELSAPASLTSYRGFLRTTKPVTHASFVVRAASGKALAYSEVADSGKTRLLVASSCYAD